MIDEKEYMKVCKKEGCFCQPFYLALKEYSNLPCYLRVLAVLYDKEAKKK